MKKVFSVFICLTLALHFVHAQDASSGFRIGLTFSPQIAWLSTQDNNIESNGAKFGYSYGLLIDAGIGKNYAIYSGINVSQSAGSLNYLDSLTKFNTFPDDSFPGIAKVDYRLQYIEIPLAFKLKTNQIGYITYYGQFGMDLGFNIRSRADFTSVSNNRTNENIGPDVTPINAGLLVGAGLEYNLSGNTSLVGGLQFMNGFIDVTDNPKDFKSKASLSYLRLLLGVYF